MMVTVLAFFLTLGVLIVVHEYGHYRVAVACGVKVLRFSVGFGRVLWRRQPRPDGTEFVVCAVERFEVLHDPVVEGEHLRVHVANHRPGEGRRRPRVQRRRAGGQEQHGLGSVHASPFLPAGRGRGLELGPVKL